MATHPGMLVAYTANGTVVGVHDWEVQYDNVGHPIALANFAADEEAGKPATDHWIVEHDPRDPRGPVKGSKVWPEYLGSQAHQFRVELTGPAGHKRITALVHRESGHRRERAPVDAAIAQRIKLASGAPADIRDLVGGPDRPLVLDNQGRTVSTKPAGTPAHLPLVGRPPGSSTP